MVGEDPRPVHLSHKWPYLTIGLSGLSRTLLPSYHPLLEPTSSSRTHSHTPPLVGQPHADVLPGCRCMHHAMNPFRPSQCPLCRTNYHHFPRVRLLCSASSLALPMHVGVLCYILICRIADNNQCTLTKKQWTLTLNPKTLMMIIIIL